MDVTLIIVVLTSIFCLVMAFLIGRDMKKKANKP